MSELKKIGYKPKSTRYRTPQKDMVDVVGLKNLRASKNLSQGQIEARTGIPQKLISRAESRGRTSKDNAIRLARFFDVSFEELIGKQSPPRIQQEDYSKLNGNSHVKGSIPSYKPEIERSQPRLSNEPQGAYKAEYELGPKTLSRIDRFLDIVEEFLSRP